MAILKRGLAGEPVRRLQAKLGVPVDGEFGPNTEAALKKWQTDKGLSADGIAGPDTFMSMGLYELICSSRARAAIPSRRCKPSSASAPTASSARAPRRPCASIKKRTA